MTEHRDDENDPSYLAPSPAADPPPDPGPSSNNGPAWAGASRQVVAHPAPRGGRVAWIPVVAVALVAGLLGGGVGAYLVTQPELAGLMGRAGHPAGPPPEAATGATGVGQAPGAGPAALPAAGLSIDVNSAISAAAARAGPAVVGIVNQVSSGQGYRTLGSGSGVIVDAGGTVVTNAHVVYVDPSLRSRQRLVVLLADGRRLEGNLAGSDDLTDLAVLRVPEANLPTVEFGDSDRLKVGDPAIAIGNPLGLEFQRSVTAGIISGTERELPIQTEQGVDTTLTVLQTDAAINPGNSGGALVNAAGQLIGINSAKVSEPGVEGIGFAIPINRARPILQELLGRGQVTRPVLGISAAPNKRQELERGLYIQEGILIWDVTPSGPAQQAGLRSGDVILAIAGKPVNRYGELVIALGQHRPGDRVELRVKRLTTNPPETFTTTVALAAPG